MTIQTIETKILEKKQLTLDTYEFTLSCPNTFEFESGQFVNLKIFHEGKDKFKAFSILNSPSEKEKITLCIKSMDKPSSSAVFRALNVGHRMQFKGPFGHFKFTESEIKEHYFLAAGTGITPFISMLRTHLNTFKNHKFTLIFGVKRKENRLYHKELIELEKNHENFTYIPVLSREDWEGKRGHVQDFLPENLENKDFYICGLKELVLETEELLLNKGVDKINIKKERYS